MAKGSKNNIGPGRKRKDRTVPRTPAQREMDRAEMMHLLRRGWTKSAVAEKFDVSPYVIGTDYKIIMKEVLKARDTDTMLLVEEELERLGEVEREAWMAYDRSKEDKEKTVEDNSESEISGIRTRTVKTTEGRLPGHEYLSVVLNCIKQRRELLALNPAKEVHVSGQMVVWDVLAGVPGAVDGQAKTLTVEEEMEALLKGRMIEGKVESVKEIRE